MVHIKGLTPYNRARLQELERKLRQAEAEARVLTEKLDDTRNALLVYQLAEEQREAEAQHLSASPTSPLCMIGRGPIQSTEEGTDDQLP